MLNPTIPASISADYAGLICLFARKLGNVPLAEDLISEAFLESLEKLSSGQISDPSRFSGFVYAVAFNLLRNYRRRTVNRADAQAGEAALAFIACNDSPLEHVHRDAIASAVRALVAELPVARDREIVRRVYLDEESKEQVCMALGLTPSLFDKVLFRARRRLRALIELKPGPLRTALIDAGDRDANDADPEPHVVHMSRTTFDSACRAS